MGRKVKFYCWDNSHELVQELSDKKFPKFIEKCNNGKMVCPSCQSYIVCEQSDSDFYSFKYYKCDNGHLNRVGLFENGNRHVTHKENTENFFPDEELSCQCDDCSLKLNAIDDTPLELPGKLRFKTKVRVEDVWRKEKALEPVTGGFDKDFEYKPTEFEQAQRKRIKDMRKGKIKVFDDKTGRMKSVDRTRNNDPAGEILD
jgi:hypothetical protein